MYEAELLKNCPSKYMNYESIRLEEAYESRPEIELP
jgi:hypothetical protein